MSDLEAETLTNWEWPNGIVSTISFKLEDVPQETLEILIGPSTTHGQLATRMQAAFRSTAVKGCEHCTRNQVFLHRYAKAADLLAARLTHPASKVPNVVRLGYWIYAQHNIQLHNDQIRAACEVAAEALAFDVARNTVIDAGMKCSAEGETK